MKQAKGFIGKEQFLYEYVGKERSLHNWSTTWNKINMDTGYRNELSHLHSYCGPRKSLLMPSIVRH